MKSIKMVKLQDYLERNPDIHIADISGVPILLDARKANILGLNETGDYIFKLLGGRALKVEKLVSHLSSFFSIDSKKCLADISPFLGEMVKEKIFLVSTSATHDESFSDIPSPSGFETLHWEIPVLSK